MYSKFSAIFILFLSTLLVACGGGGGGAAGGGGGGVPITNNVVASAGAEQTVARNTSITLDGSGSSDPDGDSLTYRWTQTQGPDVTAGAGFLTGVAPSFTAPTDVSTVIFELKVADSSPGTSTGDAVQINILEHNGTAFYVDGNNGSDSSGDGSKSNSYATISFAIDQISSAGTDLYVKTLAASARYDETAATITPPTNTSLYGGYGANWVRDVVGNRTGVDGHSIAVDFVNVEVESWFSGFDLKAADSADSSSIVSGVSVQSGQGIFYVQDNLITAGNVGTGSTSAPASSYGLRLGAVTAVRVLRNTISSGSGANGNTAAASSTPGADGGNGNNGSGDSKGSGGRASSRNQAIGTSNAGGQGGNGGTTGAEHGDKGSDGDSLTGIDQGGRGGNGSSGNGLGANNAHSGGGSNPGFDGDNGNGRRGGNGGDGAEGDGNIDTNGYFVAASGTAGSFGNAGEGGGGGGGGRASTTGFNAGGGGGGGAGGQGGRGGPAGISAGASIGISMASSDAIIDGNRIMSGQGGAGGSGAGGRFGGDGGNGGTGGARDRGPFNNANSSVGGNGGGGASGAQGGQGGGGAGGPSYGIAIVASTTPMISNNTIVGGSAGAGANGGAGGLGGVSGNKGTNPTGANCCNSTSFSSTAAPSRGGYSFGIFDSDVNDGMVAVISNNTITTGTAGAAAPNQGAAGVAGDTNF